MRLYQVRHGEIDANVGGFSNENPSKRVAQGG